MGIEGLKDVIDIVSKVGKVFKESKTIEIQENNDFLNSKSTQYLLKYLNSKYKDEEIIKILGCTLEEYIKKTRNDSIENKITNYIGIATKTIEAVTGKIKPELNELQNTIKKVQKDEHISLIKNITSIEGDKDTDPMKNMINELIGLQDESERLAFLSSHGIPVSSKTISEEKTPITEIIITPKENNNNIEIDNKKIKEGIFASESKHEKEPYKANNPKSSAIGKYQFLWNSRKDKIEEITKINNEKDYINNPKQQELFMDYVIENIYLPKAKEYQIIYPDWKLPELIMLIHFKGEKGALDWIKDKKDHTITNNISIDKYITNFKKEYYV